MGRDTSNHSAGFSTTHLQLSTGEKKKKQMPLKFKVIFNVDAHVGRSAHLYFSSLL